MSVRYVSLGGLGEIGMNCAVFELDGELLVLDCGVSFADDDTFGIDQIVPDFRPLLERVDDIAGIVITHAHQDHIGALPLLLEDLDVPVYLSRFAAGMLEQQLRQGDLPPEEVDMVLVKAGDRVQIGPFDVEFIHVTHSIPETLAVALTTPVGVLVHTADFKIDEDPLHEEPIDRARFEALGSAGVRALFSDSTNIERPGRTVSERAVHAGLHRAVATAPGRVLVTLFATNTERMQALVDAAIETGRSLLLLGRSLQRTFAVARSLGLIQMPRDVIIDEESAKRARPDALLVALTGSQAQSQTALARMAFESLNGLRVEAGDRVIFSARAIPGNEAPIARLKDQIVRRGGEIHDAPDVHCSGHAMRDEQAEMLAWVRPQTFIPVHGDYRYLVAHARLAEAQGCPDTAVLDNGQVLEIGPRTARLVGLWETGKVYVDGTPFGTQDGEAMRARRRVARGGLLVVSVAIDAGSGDVRSEVTIENVGVADDVFVSGWLHEVGPAVAAALRGLPRRQRLDRDKAAEAMRVEALRVIKRGSKRRAYVHTVVTYV